jgi:23S rRNA (adenine1618-N6)-methyltransferase
MTKTPSIPDQLTPKLKQKLTPKTLPKLTPQSPVPQPSDAERRSAHKQVLERLAANHPPAKKTASVVAAVAVAAVKAATPDGQPKRRTSIPKAKRLEMAAAAAVAAGGGRPAPTPAELHPRNRHQGRYDMPRLLKASPPLAKFITKTPYGDLSIDFANPLAVKALNTALLSDWYGLQQWDFPEGFLCPPIPGRADYVHHLADLLASSDGGKESTIPRGWQVRVLDIGVGANGVYPLIGHGEYGWSYVGSDIHPAAINSLEKILAANPNIARHIELRRQTSPARIFTGIIDAEEEYDLTMCNPPFHASAAEAHAGSQRKWRNLGKTGHAGKSGKSGKSATLNFGGQASELWCQGGEVGFITRMIDDSTKFKTSCAWFTTLVAQEVHVAKLERKATSAGAATVRVIPMSQGQKRSRILAWTFLDPDGLRDWRQRRWTKK